MDSIVGLPESGGYIMIWIIVGFFSKMADSIPLPSVNKTKCMVKLLHIQVWKHHWLPDDIVSDRDSRFIYYFRQSQIDLLSIKLNLSTAFHSQTDGQTEKDYQTLEAQILNYYFYQQDD
jgi:hypothetical protein